MNIKIEQKLNFVVDNDSRLFLDAQEAKKVTYSSLMNLAVSRGSLYRLTRGSFPSLVQRSVIGHP